MTRLLLAAVMTALSVGCTAADERPRVRIAIGGQTQMVYLPTTLADALGFYREAGIDVELQDFQGGAKALQALIGGSADVVSGYYDHTIQMAAERRELVAFVTMLRTPGLVLATSPRFSAEVTSIGQLRGKVAGVTTPGSSSHMFLNVLLARHQVPTDAVSVTTIGAGPTAIAAMERGMVAAGWLADPSFTLVHARNPGVRVLADLRNEAGTLAAFGTSTYPGAVLYANAAWLDSHRTVAAGLAGAIVRTLEWMHAHSATEIASRTPRALRGEDDALFIQSLQNSMTMFSTDGVMHREGAEAVRELLAGSIDKVRAANVDLAKTYTNDFVESRKSGTGSRMSPER